MASPTTSTATTKTTGSTDTTITDVVIGLDVGTQSTKAVLYDPTSHTVLSRSSKSYGLLSTDVEGRAEQDPATWIDAVHHCLSSLSSSLKGDGGDDGTGGSSGRRLSLVGVGVSGQQHGMVCLDSDFRVVRAAKLWCDVESAPQARALSEELSKLRGQPVNVPPGFTAPKVKWLKENEPENFARTEYILLPHEYVNLVLCAGDVEESAPRDRELSEPLSELRGQPLNVTTAPKVGWPREGEPENFARTGGSDERYVASDAGDASGTGVFDTTARTYDLRAAAECVDTRYPSMLPKRMLGPLDTVGELCPEWRRICGLGDGDPPVVISAGSGDNMCSALGCGVVSSTGDAVLSLGTSGTIFGVSDSPVSAVVMEGTGGPRPSAVAPFCDATGKHLPLVCVMSCTGVLNDVLRNMCRHSPSSSNEDGSPMTHAEAEELASQVPPGCHGLTFHPYLGGERTPDWPTATGSLVGITSSNISYLGGENSAGVWYRAALEGISYNLRMALDEMRLSCGPSGGGSGGAAGFDPSGLLVVGGGSTNRLWRRILADVLGMELRFPVESESAALGAAFQAGAAAEAAASAGNSGDILSLGDYIRARPIRLEEEEEDGLASPVVVVTPTDNGTVREAYRVGYERFVASAHGLFGGGNGGSGSNSGSDSSSNSNSN